MQSPEVIQVSSFAVNRLVVVAGKLWACSQNRIRVINPTTSVIEVSSRRQRLSGNVDSVHCPVVSIGHYWRRLVVLVVALDTRCQE